MEQENATQDIPVLLRIIITALVLAAFYGLVFVEYNATHRLQEEDKAQDNVLRI